MLQKLQYQTVEQNTLGVLRGLFRLSVLEHTRLVGGTSLALQFGHRRSVDIDMFGQINLVDIFASNVLNEIGQMVLLNRSSSILTLSINEVKVDLVNYNYPWIEKPIDIDDLRLAGTKDIAAMKLAAFAGRGSKKDFIDLYFLLQNYSLSNLMTFYKEKYRDGSEFLVLKSLTYFTDAESEDSPFMFAKLSWERTKDFIQNAFDQYMKRSQ